MKLIMQIFILFIACLILPSVLFGQAKNIASESYYSVLKEAESKTEKQIRKRVQIQNLYRSQEISATLTDTTEYLPPDKSVWIHVEERGNVVKRIEQITIGNLIYRKENNGKWVKDKKDIGYGISGKDNSTREFFIEEVTVGKEKVQILIMKTVNYNNTYFDESKIWINNKGLILKKFSATSHLELKNIVSSVDVTYNYKLKSPKIKAPIK
jgi:hypothetical protein